MTSRERVLKALRHEEPDRVPIDLGGAIGTGIYATNYKKLKDFLGIKGGKIRIYEPWQQLAKPEPEVLEKIGADVISITLPGITTPKNWKSGTLRDGTPCEVPIDWNPVRSSDGSLVQMFRGKEIARMPPNGYYFDPIYAPLADADYEDLQAFNWPAPFSFYRLPDRDEADQYVVGLAEEVRYWHENSDLALFGNFGGGIFEAAWGLRGFENFMRDLTLNRKFIEALLDKLVESNIEYAKRYLEAAGEYLQVIMVGGEDIGTQNRPIISPKMYREIIQPRHSKLWQFIKNNTSASLCVHSCGAIYKIIPDFIEAGMDCLNPVQVAATDMDTRRLKTEFGEKITFWGGGCDTQHILPLGTPEKVNKEVQQRINDLAPGGGFIFAQVHNIQADVPIENIIAMYDAAHTYGKYETT